MANTIQIKRGTTTPTNGTLAAGELGYCSGSIPERGLYIGNTTQGAPPIKLSSTAFPTVIAASAWGAAAAGSMSDHAAISIPSSISTDHNLFITIGYVPDSATYDTIVNAKIVFLSYTSPGLVVAKALGDMTGINSIDIPLVVGVF